MVGLGLALFLAGSAYMSVQAIVLARRGDYLSAGISGGFAMATIGLALSIIIARIRSKTLRGSAASTGTTLRPDPVVTGILALSFAAMTPTAALYLVFAPRGEVHFSLATPGRQLVTYFYMTVLLICGVGGLIGLIHRRGRGHLRLASGGFEFTKVITTQQGSWDDVIDVTDQAEHKQANQPIVLVMKNATPVVVKNAGGYAPSGAALYWMVRHYWKHPERRDELTDGRALERLRTEDFEPE